jgi:protein-tyrosine phosphatase
VRLVIDLHSHILPDLDDGARSVEDSLDMARACVADGIAAVAATPHVRDDYPTTVAQMEASVGAVRYELARAGIQLEVLTGGEICLEYLDRLSLDDIRRFGLGGNPAYVLLEFPYHGWPLRLPNDISRLVTEGITPVIAHPERSAELEDYPDRIEPLVRRGALVQITAASLDGRLGKRIRKTTLELLELELVHLVASDAHHPLVREGGLAAAVEAVEDPVLARWLVNDVPSAIVRNTPLPERPLSAGRKRWRK